MRFCCSDVQAQRTPKKNKLQLLLPTLSRQLPQAVTLSRTACQKGFGKFSIINLDTRSHTPYNWVALWGNLGLSIDAEMNWRVPVHPGFFREVELPESEKKSGMRKVEGRWGAVAVFPCSPYRCEN
jgi:hypothetical protein